jgi:hypothetical protein
MAIAQRSLKPYPPSNVAVADSSTAGSTYPQTDLFDAATIDLTKWVQYGSGTHYTQTEASGVLTITADATTPSSQGGIKSVNTSLTLVNRQMSVALVTAIQQVNQQNWFLVADSLGRFAGFQITPGTINFVHSVVGSTGIAYNAPTHKYLRFRYDSATGNLLWDTSTDGITWTNRRTLASGSTNLTVAAVQFFIQLNANLPGVTISNVWDNFVYSDSTVSGPTGQARISWNNRNRLTSGIKKQTASADALESGQTHTVRIYKADGTTLLRTATGLTTSPYDYTATQELTDTGVSFVQPLIARIKSINGSLESAEQSIVIPR